MGTNIETTLRRRPRSVKVATTLARTLCSYFVLTTDNWQSTEWIANNVENVVRSDAQRQTLYSTLTLYSMLIQRMPQAPRLVAP